MTAADETVRILGLSLDLEVFLFLLLVIFLLGSCRLACGAVSTLVVKAEASKRAVSSKGGIGV